MLKTHTAPDTAPPTTQEIAQAIASLEARSASHADQAAQTVTVSEVIQHLGLDMTAEDVLAEIHARRARQAKTPTPRRNKRIAGILAGGALAIAWALGELLAPQYDNSLPPSLPAAAQASFFPMPKPLGIAPNTLVQDTVGDATVLKTLAEIPDGHPVKYSFLSEGAADSSNPLWTLVKHQGKVYLRCWTVPMSAQAMQQANLSTGITLFCGQAGSVGDVRATAPLTLALQGITLPDGMSLGGRGAVPVSRLHLDKYAHEKWKP